MEANKKGEYNAGIAAIKAAFVAGFFALSGLNGGFIVCIYAAAAFQ
jgi:hypothetical protein